MPRRPAARRSAAAIRDALRVDVPAPAADEAAKRDPAVLREFNREHDGPPTGDHQRAACHRRLLDQLEREPPADAENRLREWGPALGKAQPTTLSSALCRPTSSRRQRARPRPEQPGRVQAPAAIESGLRLRRRSGRPRRAPAHHGQLSFTAPPRRRPPRARPFRRRRTRTRVEARRTPEPHPAPRPRPRSRPGRPAAGASTGRRPSVRAEAERELLVVPGRPHRHRDRLALDPNLERLLDRQPVGLEDPVGQTRDGHARGRTRHRLHRVKRSSSACAGPAQTRAISYT